MPTHDTLNRLQNLAGPKDIDTATYTATYNDDHLLSSVTTSITLPPSRAGKEIEVTMIGTGNVTVVPTGTDTLVGTTSVVMTAQWMSLRFKSVSGGWILI